MEATYDYMAKILLLGETKVGKSALIKRFYNDEFCTTYNATIGVDFQNKIASCNGKRLKMQIWDAAGEKKYRSIVSTYYKGTMGIILVYAVDDRNSFQSIEKWFQEIKSKDLPNVTIALVGNKCDLNERQVSYEEGKEIADKNGLIFFETSVKEGIYVAELFHQMGNDIYETQLSVNTVDSNFNLNRTMKDATFDFMVRILLLGEAKVGKSALMKRFSNDEFCTTYNATVGVDFQNKIASCNGKRLKIQIWDTAGEQKYRSIVPICYKGTMGIILVYAVDDRNSFQSIEKWLQEIRSKDLPNVSIALVGNKCDLQERVVSYEEGKEIADKNGLIFFETSVKEGINVDELFYQMGTDINKTWNKELQEQPPVES